MYNDIVIIHDNCNHNVIAIVQCHDIDVLRMHNVMNVTRILITDGTLILTSVLTMCGTTLAMPL